MDQFTYLADPHRSLQMHNSAYLEQVKKAEGRHARHDEGPRRGRASTDRAVSDELVSRPRSTRRVGRLTWRGLLEALRVAGSVR